MHGQPHPTIISIDPLKSAKGQKGLMNRWHPDIPAFATVKQGEVFKLETIEWTGGQIRVRSCPPFARAQLKAWRVPAAPPGC